MSYFSLKLFFDFLAALILLFFLAPVLLLIMFITGFVLLESPFFLHKRIGKDGAEFNIIKVKTMRTGEEEPHRNQVLQFLRKSSLDELPQLINVLFGQMSIVGPRPLPIQYSSFIKPQHKERHKLRPGITGLSQISGGNELSWNERFELDMRYVKEVNFRLDLSILLKTIFVIFKRKKDTSVKLTDSY